MARGRKPEPLVRYISPFGSPAWMKRAEAERHLKHDDDLWLRYTEIERQTGERVLSDAQRQVGAPRIERAG